MCGTINARLKSYVLLIVFLFSFVGLKAQSNLVTYAGSTGKETFYDVLQITDGTFLVCGYADDLS